MAPDTDRKWIRWNPQAGSFLKWTEQVAGFTLEGTFLGLTEGDYGPLGQIERPDAAIVKFPMPAVLKDRLTMPRGTYVKLIYEGRRPGKNGKDYHAFEVLSDPATIPEGAARPPDAEEGPF